MTSQTNFQHKFWSLCQDIAALDSSSVPNLPAVENLLDRLLLFMSAFVAYLKEQEELLDERLLLQHHFDLTVLDKKLQEHFYRDQLSFLKHWVAVFEKSIYQSAGSCQLNISSRDVLYLIRLLRDAEVLERSDLKYTFHFLSGHFHTPQQDKLSAESLRKKYSQLDIKMISNTELLLKRLLDINAAYRKTLSDGGK